MTRPVPPCASWQAPARRPQPWRVGALTYHSNRAYNGIQVDQGVARKAK